jgi:hypothetical protein
VAAKKKEVAAVEAPVVEAEKPKKKVAAKKKEVAAVEAPVVEAEKPKKKVAAKKAKAVEAPVEVVVVAELVEEELMEEEIDTEINVTPFTYEGVKYNRGEDDTVYSVPGNEEIGRWTGSVIEFAAVEEDEE